VIANQNANGGQAFTLNVSGNLRTGGRRCEHSQPLPEGPPYRRSHGINLGNSDRGTCDFGNNAITVKETDRPRKASARASNWLFFPRVLSVPDRNRDREQNAKRGSGVAPVNAPATLRPPAAGRCGDILRRPAGR